MLNDGKLVGVSLRIFLWMGAIVSLSSTICGQEISPGTFELNVPGLEIPSLAKVTQNELAIRDGSGTVTRYQRQPRYDTSDQQLVGFVSRKAQQVIRWPIDNAGRMQIGTLQNGTVQFAWSKMTITESRAPGDSNPPMEVLPPGMDERHLQSRNSIGGPPAPAPKNIMNLPQMTAIQLAIGDQPSDRQFLTFQGDNQVGFLNQANAADSAWYIAPVSNNIVRLQQRQQNNWIAVGLGNIPDASAITHRLGNRKIGGFGVGNFPPGGSFGGGGGFRGPTGNFPISLAPIHNGADQLWRIQQGIAGGYLFESVLYPGMCLSGLTGQGLSLLPINYSTQQIWWPQIPTFVLPQPQFRTLDQQVVPNTPLGPVNARIVNSHSETIMVLVADRRNPQHLQKLRIPAGGSERVQLDRDAGATIIETVETLDAFGNWNQQQFSTPVPPSVLYDMSVYEEFLQSIAIDRTGKSPNPIEDVNYQPRSVGFFLVPPGDELPELADIDAYRIADDAQNPGAVRRLSQREMERNNTPPTKDPLKEMLNQFQKQRAAF